MFLQKKYLHLVYQSLGSPKFGPFLKGWGWQISRDSGWALSIRISTIVLLDTFRNSLLSLSSRSIEVASSSSSTLIFFMCQALSKAAFAVRYND